MTIRLGCLKRASDCAQNLSRSFSVLTPVSLSRANAQNLLAENAVLNPDYRGLGDIRMERENIFDLRRIYLFAALDDQVVLTAAEVIVAILAHPEVAE